MMLTMKSNWKHRNFFTLFVTKQPSKFNEQKMQTLKTTMQQINVKSIKHILNKTKNTTDRNCTIVEELFFQLRLSTLSVDLYIPPPTTYHLATIHT